MPKTNAPRIAVLGAGPVGLEAALYARNLDYTVHVYEAGRIGEYLQRWGHVRLFSPFGMNVTELGRATILDANPRHDFPDDQACITGKEHLSCYLDPVAKCEVLKGCIHTETQVVAVGRTGLLKGDGVGDGSRGKQPFRLLLRDAKKQERIAEADIVLDCTGTYGQHRWLGSGGIPAPGELAAERYIAYGLENILGERKNHYANKTTLVVGDGCSAATAVCQLAELAEKNPDTWVVWVARSGSQPLRRIPGDPLKERDRLAARANTLATRREGNVEFHADTHIDAIEFTNPDQGFRVKAQVAGQGRSWQVDRIIAHVGYTPNAEIYRELQIHECYATLGPMKLAAALQGQPSGDCLKQSSLGAETLRNPEPGYYVLGAKSYGRNSDFLLRVGFDQVREVFTLITGKVNLDLYKKR
jgi:thioredoxin reductase